MQITNDSEFDRINWIDSVVNAILNGCTYKNKYRMFLSGCRYMFSLNARFILSFMRDKLIE